MDHNQVNLIQLKTVELDFAEYIHTLMCRLRVFARPPYVPSAG